MSRRFAHNTHEIEGCSCPAIEAGFDVSKDKTHAQSKMYRMYDKVAREDELNYQDSISEVKAQAYWSEAINRVQWEKAAEFGRKVQAELGWD